jgi:hypothetical protein
MDKYMLPHLGQGNTGWVFYNGMFAVSTVIARDAGVQLTGSPGKTAPATLRSSARKSMSPLSVILIVP